MNTLDTRDLIEEFEGLEIEVENETIDEDDAERYAALKCLLDDLKGCGGDEEWRGDWYPGTLIDVDDFEDYAQELAEECGMVNESASWPNNCIDWELAARELAYDYSTVDFDGDTYYYRYYYR